MADPATQAQAPVAPAATVDDRLTSFFQTKEEAPPKADVRQSEPAEPAPEPAQAEEGEPAPEDIPDEAAAEETPSDGDAFEIVHNGTQHKLSREETIKYAQQGFDYTQKTQAVAEKAKALETMLQRAQEIEQVMPLLAKEQAEVAAVKSQLDQYKDVDWVRLATDQPLEYPKYRAQYDLLVQSYNAGAYRLNEAAQAIQQRKQEITAQQLQHESARLRELVPEWKEPEKYAAGAKQLRGYLIAQGAPAERVDQLTDALSVSIAYKAMKYDQLVKSKGEKSKLLQSTPPVSKPGVAQPPNAAAREQYQKLRGELKKSGELDAAARLFARVERTKR